MREIKLGEKVKDIVSDFTGIAICRMEYMNGCVRYTVQGKQVKSSKDVPTMDIDMEQLVRVDDGMLKKKKVSNTGGPKSYAVKNSVY